MELIEGGLAVIRVAVLLAQEEPLGLAQSRSLPTSGTTIVIGCMPGALGETLGLGFLDVLANVFVCEILKPCWSVLC